MNRILMLLFQLLSYPIFSFGQSMLWEELSVKEQDSLVAKRDSDCLERMIYEGKWAIDDVPELWEMLDRFVKDVNNNGLDPLAFYIFNKICSKADGAVSEGIGVYCQFFSEKCPNQVISLFKKNDLYFDIYSYLIGCEIAQRGYPKNMTCKLIATIKKKMFRSVSKTDRPLVRAYCREIENVALSVSE